MRDNSIFTTFQQWFGSNRYELYEGHLKDLEEGNLYKGKTMTEIIVHLERTYYDDTLRGIKFSRQNVKDFLNSAKQQTLDVVEEFVNTDITEISKPNDFEDYLKEKESPGYFFSKPTF